MTNAVGVGKARANVTHSPNPQGRGKLSERATSAGPAGAGAEAGPCARSRERLPSEPYGAHTKPEGLRNLRSKLAKRAPRGERHGAGGLWSGNGRSDLKKKRTLTRPLGTLSHQGRGKVE